MPTAYVTDVNFTSGQFKANPFPFYERLRAESPVYVTQAPDKRRVWLITRYDDVLAILKDDAQFVKDRHLALTATQAKQQPWIPAFLKGLERNMLDLDGADHARLRGLVHKAFTPRLIEHMRERIQTIADELLDKAQARGRTMDLIEDYALPIPLTVIAEILGIPAKDTPQFHHWTKGILSLTAPHQLIWKLPSFLRFKGYLQRMFAERRRQPTDDLTSALVAAEQEGAKLTEEELLSMVIILIIAGHETTVNLIGSGTLALLEQPDALAQLRANPQIIRPALEELVRFVSPVESATERYPIQDVTLHNVTIPRGELMLVSLASANRDDAIFEQPNQLNLTREPNRHLSFGQGTHYCVGAPLARMEGSIAINTLLKRLPDLRLTVPAEKLKWRSNLVLRGLEALPVAF